MKLSVLTAVLAMSISTAALAEKRSTFEYDDDLRSEHAPMFRQARWLPLSSMMTAKRRNIIQIPDDRDELRAIRLVNGNGMVFVYAIRLVYGDGHRETISVNKWLYAGDTEMTFKLAPKHTLERINVQTWADSRATFQVLGQRARRVASPPIYEPPQPPLPVPAALSLGKDLSFTNTGSLNFAVGADKGEFSALRIESSALDTFIGHIHVTFASGARQTIDVNRTMHRGELLNLDLEGNRQAITSLVLMQSHDGYAHGPGRFSVTLVR